MSNYRRLFIDNSYVFLTIVTGQRQPILIVNIDVLRQAFINTKMNYNFEIYASVILPDHLHLILNPQNIADYPKIIHSIKYYFSKNVAGGIVIPPYVDASKVEKGDREIWQRRYFEHTIRDDEDLYKHLDYIHYNPVKHGYAKNVQDWEFSSFYKFVKMNNYYENWGSADDIKHITELDYN